MNLDSEIICGTESDIINTIFSYFLDNGFFDQSNIILLYFRSLTKTLKEKIENNNVLWKKKLAEFSDSNCKKIKEFLFNTVSQNKNMLNQKLFFECFQLERSIRDLKRIFSDTDKKRDDEIEKMKTEIYQKYIFLNKIYRILSVFSQNFDKYKNNYKTTTIKVDEILKNVSTMEQDDEKEGFYKWFMCLAIYRMLIIGTFENDMYLEQFFEKQKILIEQQQIGNTISSDVKDVERLLFYYQNVKKHTIQFVRIENIKNNGMIELPYYTSFEEYNNSTSKTKCFIDKISGNIIDIDLSDEETEKRIIFNYKNKFDFLMNIQYFVKCTEPLSVENFLQIKENCILKRITRVKNKNNTKSFLIDWNDYEQTMFKSVFYIPKSNQLTKSVFGNLCSLHYQYLLNQCYLFIFCHEFYNLSLRHQNFINPNNIDSNIPNDVDSIQNTQSQFIEQREQILKRSGKNYAFPKSFRLMIKILNSIDTVDARIVDDKEQIYDESSSSIIWRNDSEKIFHLHFEKEFETEIECEQFSKPDKRFTNTMKVKNIEPIIDTIFSQNSKNWVYHFV